MGGGTPQQRVVAGRLCTPYGLYQTCGGNYFLGIIAAQSSAQTGVVSIPDHLMANQDAQLDHAIVIITTAHDPLPHLEYAIVFGTILGGPVL